MVAQRGKTQKALHDKKNPFQVTEKVESSLIDCHLIWT